MIFIMPERFRPNRWALERRSGASRLTLTTAEWCTYVCQVVLKSKRNKNQINFRGISAEADFNSVLNTE